MIYLHAIGPFKPNQPINLISVGHVTSLANRELVRRFVLTLRLKTDVSGQKRGGERGGDLAYLLEVKDRCIRSKTWRRS